MRKIISFFIAMLLCLSLVLTAAAEVSFVPSITAKPAPEAVAGTEADGTAGADGSDDTQRALVIKDEERKVVSSSRTALLLVTSVAEVMNEEAKALPQENADNLKEAYKLLSSEDVVLTEVVDDLAEVVEEKQLDASRLVVKDLFDVRLSEESFEAELDVEGYTIDVTFMADIQEGQTVLVLVYKDGQWTLAKEVIVGTDGSVTATLEHLGAVAIIVC